MKVSKLVLDSGEEVIVKIVKEILNLFKVELDTPVNDADFMELRICNHVEKNDPVMVRSRLELVYPDGRTESWERSHEAAADEKASAARHRLIKLNLYKIFVEELQRDKAPWGILHGVRPTKIIHRYMGLGAERAEVEKRLQDDFAVSSEKTKLLTDVAYCQLPFLADTDNKTVSIYVGIPFCLSRCLYCSFPAYVLPGREKLQEFMQVFRKDLLAVKSVIDLYGLKVQNIYIGGGTPTSLPEDFFDEMLQLVYNSFYGADTKEFTVEAGRPDSISPAKIKSMEACQVDRVSVNPQSMQARTLKRIGRNHSPEDIEKMFHLLRQSAIPHINMDVIIGLPGEDVADIKDTMQKIIALGPDDITLHALALKRGSMLKMNLSEIELPTDARAQEMYNAAFAMVAEAGYHPYYLYRQGYMAGQLENIGCCRPGAEGLYNIQIMEENQTILGIGGAAATKVVGCAEGRMKTSFNAKDLITYLQSVDVYIEKRAALLQEAYGSKD